MRSKSNAHHVLQNNNILLYRAEHCTEHKNCTFFEAWKVKALVSDPSEHCSHTNGVCVCGIVSLRQLALSQCINSFQNPPIQNLHYICHIHVILTDDSTGGHTEFTV